MFIVPQVKLYKMKLKLKTSFIPGFKWLGNLSNLSTRRPSEKDNIKAVPEHDGILSAATSAAGGQSVDDMEPCLHSPSYAHSSEMYTHVGTVPRSQKKKMSCKGLKEKKKKKEEEEEGASGRKSQWEAGEHVQPSPLLSALSSLNLSSLDRPLPVSAPDRPLPATPVPKWASPLTSASDPSGDPLKSQEASSHSKYAIETEKSVREPLNMATNGPKVASSQDLYVHMDPIAEAARSHTEAGSSFNLKEVENINR